MRPRPEKSLPLRGSDFSRRPYGAPFPRFFTPTKSLFPLYPRFVDIVGQTRAQCRSRCGSCFIAYLGPLMLNLGCLSTGPRGIQIRRTCGARNLETFASSALYRCPQRPRSTAPSFGGRVASKCEASPTLMAAAKFPSFSTRRRSGKSILTPMSSLSRVKGTVWRCRGASGDMCGRNLWCGSYREATLGHREPKAKR